MKATIRQRVHAAARTHSLRPLLKSEQRVPDYEARSCIPDPTCRVVADYLLEDSRVTRRETTIEVYLSNVGTRALDIECSLPNLGSGTASWYLPVAFFPKNEVAPNLEVTKADGEMVAVPTKSQNYAITQQAIRELFSTGKLEKPRPELRRLIDEVIAEEVPTQARARRWIFESEAPHLGELARLLRIFEENFVLWVPLAGEPESDHQLRVCRREIHHLDRIFVPRPLYGERMIETAVGEARLEGYLNEGKRITFRPRALIERLPRALALRPIEATAVDIEAGRACSTHLRVQAPPGFVVRDIRAGEMRTPEEQEEDPQIVELHPKEDNVVIQGWDQILGHVHLAKPRNPPLFCLVTLGPRSGQITLWMLATLLAAVILWVLHHHSRYGPGLVFPPPSQLVDFPVGKRPHLAIGGEDKQIAAAVLLIGPALASAWAVRADGDEVLRSFLAGARFLLLLSAAVSIAAALALAGVLPSGVSSYTAMEIYAGLAYLVAAPMFAAWLLSSRPVWDAFRWVLKSPGPNLLLIGMAGSLVLAVGLMPSLPPRAAGGVLLASGLGLALIGANPVPDPLLGDKSNRFESRARHRTVAGVSSIPITVIAGSFLGFYAAIVPFGLGRVLCFIVGVELLYCAARLHRQLVSE